MSLGWILAAGNFLFNVFKGVGSVFTGGSLDSILRTIDKGMSDEVRKEEIKAKVTEVWINAQASLLVGRTWWFQLFFVIPAGLYWSAIIFVSVFTGLNWEVQRLPGFAEEVFLGIVSALFIIDGGKALAARFTK